MNSWFIIRSKFGTSVRQYVDEHGDDGRQGVETVRRQYMRKQGFEQ